MNKNELIIQYLPAIIIFINLVYFTAAKLVFKLSKASTSINYKPEYSLYRLCNKSFIANYPSKSGQEFYRLYNKITFTFNTVYILSFSLYIYLQLLEIGIFSWFRYTYFKIK